MLGQLSFTNILTTVTAILASVYTFATNILHCTADAAGAATCALPSWVPVQVTGYVTLAFGVLAFIMKFVRPGGVKASLWGPVAVVVPESDTKNSVAGTATPQHVMSP